MVSALQSFQDEMAKVKNDPYKVVMKQTKLPITLLNETAKVWKSECGVFLNLS
jgi:nuclear GTP-binding protein